VKFGGIGHPNEQQQMGSLGKSGAQLGSNFDGQLDDPGIVAILAQSALKQLLSPFQPIIFDGAAQACVAIQLLNDPRHRRL
jgi:hypothetical protein